MTFPEYLEQRKAEAEGNPYFRLLQSNLTSGHAIQRVRLEAANGSARYVFVLARLGTLTEVEVPVGGPAVERFLFETGLKMNSREEEMLRCALHLKRRMEPLAATLGAAAGKAALHTVVRELGAPRSAKAVLDASNGTPSPPAARLAAEVLRAAIDGYLGSLFIELHYPVKDAGEILDLALESLVKAG